MSDAFHARLDEINKEMSDLLENGTRKREEMSASYTAEGATGSRYAPLISTSSDVVSREVNICVSREMANVQDQLRDLVRREWETRASQMDQLLRSRFVELRDAHEEVVKAVAELSGLVASAKKDSQQSTALLEKQFSSRFSELRHDLQELERGNAREIKALKEDVADFISASRDESREMQSQFERNARRLADRVEKGIANAENSVSEVREEMMDNLRSAVRRNNEQFDELQRHLKELHSNIGIAETTIKKTFGRVGEISDDHGAHNSELRSLRSDVMRIEAMLEQKIDKFPGSQRAGASAAELMRLHQDVYALKESVAFLGEAVQGNEVRRPSGVARHADPVSSEPKRHARREDAPVRAAAVPQYEPVQQSAVYSEEPYAVPRSTLREEEVSGYQDEANEGPRDWGSTDDDSEVPTESEHDLDDSKLARSALD